MTAPLLELDGIEFSYGAVQVLFGVDMVVGDGEILALLGTNGAGKSTLLRVVAGLAAPSSGTVRFDGEDVTGADAAAMVARGLVMMPGGKAVFPDLTVSDNLAVGAFSLRDRPEVLAARRSEALDLFPRLAQRLGTPAGAMSGGEQQQLALAKALMLRPRLLCIDELSLGLAPVVVEDLLAAVRRVHAAGTTIVLVEQSLNVAASLCDRALFLEKGAVRFEGAIRDLVGSSDLARAVFLGAAVEQLERVAADS